MATSHLVAPTGAAPGTLIDVIQCVVSNFQTNGDGTPIVVGKKYLTDTMGEPNRIVFVPEPKGGAGRIAPPMNSEFVASMIHSCDVVYLASATGDDVTRFLNVYSLNDWLIGAITTAASGRLEFGPASDASPVDTDERGVAIAFSFTYQRDIVPMTSYQPAQGSATLTSLTVQTIPVAGD